MDTSRYIRYLSLRSPVSTFRIYFHYKSNLAFLSFCVMTAYGVKSIRYLCLQTVKTFFVIFKLYHMDGFCVN
jgi:hypothetical protein